MSGLFITMEGIDGCGKSTQSKLLYDYLRDSGHKVILTREPGGTSISEKIREIIIDKENNKMFPLTEAFLYAASRSQHANEIIRPALLDNYIVICDRFLDSSIAYQGVARGIGSETIEIINSYAIVGLKPDITFLFDLDPVISLNRKAASTIPDRIESEKMDFHKKVRNGYNMLAEKNQDRIFLIDATQSMEDISKIVFNKISEYLEEVIL